MKPNAIEAEQAMNKGNPACASSTFEVFLESG